MARGTPETVPDDGLTTKQRRNRPMVIVNQGEGKGKVNGGLRSGAARLEPGMEHRGLPVREVGEVADR